MSRFPAPTRSLVLVGLGIVAILIVSPVLAKHFFMHSPKKSVTHLSSPTVETGGRDSAAQLGVHPTPLPTSVDAIDHPPITATSVPCVNKIAEPSQKPPKQGEA